MKFSKQSTPRDENVFLPALSVVLAYTTEIEAPLKMSFPLLHFSLGSSAETIPFRSLFSGYAAISMSVDEREGTLIKLQRLILLQVILHKLHSESLIFLFSTSRRGFMQITLIEGDVLPVAFERTFQIHFPTSGAN